jgi:hypothetical protein
MSGKQRLVVGCVSALAAGASLVYVIGRARAAGVPSTPPVMTYSGTLTDASGTPLTGTKNVQVQLWAQASGGSTPVCLTPSTAQALVGGSFQIPLPDTCTAAVHANAELWAEVSVDGSPLPRTKIGAVPYALEAGTATTASGALDTRLSTLMPPKSIIAANLTATDIGTNFDATGRANTPGAYAGWAICNGNNGTPNLANRFARMNVSAAGATGGDDVLAHTHAIDHDHTSFASKTESGHTHATPAHQHVLPFGYDLNYFYFTYDSGGVGVPPYGSNVIDTSRIGEVINPGVGPSGLARVAYTDASGAGTTGPGDAHGHVVDPPPFAGTSGPASASDNRPAYYELVPLMRL